MPHGLLLLAFALLTGGFLSLQWALVERFGRLLRHSDVTPPPRKNFPKTAVVMCLRGSDPFLRKTLQALVGQSVEPSVIVLMVDHPSDPAVDDVRAALKDSLDQGKSRLLFLEQPRDVCSLKCSSLVQACGEVPADVELVAFLDADTLPDVDWLARLIRPFQNPDVGVVTGNRWFDPERASLGAVARQVWNAAAIVQMSEYAIPWGGTLCVRRSFLERANLLDKWGKAFCEDTMLRREAAKVGSKVVFDPTLLTLNGEDCSVGEFTSWCSRQLLTARLYHPAWILVSGHATLSAGIPIAATVAAIVYALLGMWPYAAAYAATLAVYCLANSALVERIYQIVAALFRRMERPLRPRTMTAVALQAGLVGLSPFLYLTAYVGSLTLRRVRWRGIDYEIRGPWDVRMLGYRPYAERATGSERSL